MSYKFDFAEGEEFVNSCYADMMENACDVLEVTLGDKCHELLKEQPWEHLREYLVSCFTQMFENMIPQIRNELDEFIEGDGGFISFAENTMNSDDAIDFARDVSSIFVEMPDELAKYQSYVDDIDRLPAEAKGDPNEVKELLTNMFEEGISDLEDYRSTYLNQIDTEADENAFVAPLGSVAEILFGVLSSWFEGLLNSVDPFCDNAQALIDEGVDKSNAAREDERTKVTNFAQDAAPNNPQ